MKLDVVPFATDLFTIAFIDMTPTGGKPAMTWDKAMAAVPFQVGK